MLPLLRTETWMLVQTACTASFLALQVVKVLTLHVLTLHVLTLQVVKVLNLEEGGAFTISSADQILEVRAVPEGLTQN